MNYLTKLALLASIFLLISTNALSDRDLIGWSEDHDAVITDNVQRPTKTITQQTTNPLPTQTIPKYSHRNEKRTKIGPEVVSWDPRIFLFRGLLTDEECDHLIKEANPYLHRSGVVSHDDDDDDTGISDVRTSDGMFFDRGQDEIISRVETKLSEWSLIPVGHGEGLQVLRYKINQSYSAHFDYFFHEAGDDNGGNRLATILMYLQTPDEGGETVFPNAPVREGQSRETGFSECAMKGAAVKPIKGDAVLFWSLRTDGTLDKGSLHASCPVLRGEKYAATKWFHVAHYAMYDEVAKKVKHVVFRPPPPPAPWWCKDNHKACPGWADGGECENNAGYMLDNCKLSCGRCDLMAPPGMN